MGDTVGHMGGGDRFAGISSDAGGSARGGDALRLVPAAMGLPHPRPSTGERGE
jgi:hypothetical protein